jgi:hypothetical protein
VAANVWGEQSMSHDSRMTRVLWVLECAPVAFDKNGKPRWSKTDRELADEALHLAHEDWEKARAKVTPAQPKQSRAERVAQELGL